MENDFRWAIEKGYVDLTIADAYGGPPPGKAIQVNSTAVFYRINSGPWYRAEINKCMWRCKQWLSICLTETDVHEALMGVLHE